MRGHEPMWDQFTLNPTRFSRGSASKIVRYFFIDRSDGIRSDVAYNG
jgi:hypothetical protein